MTKDSEYWITELEVICGELRKVNVQLFDYEFVNHIISNSTEEYKKIVQNMEDDMYDDVNPLIIDSL